MPRARPLRDAEDVLVMGLRLLFKNDDGPRSLKDFTNVVNRINRSVAPGPSLRGTGVIGGERRPFVGAFITTGRALYAGASLTLPMAFGGNDEDFRQSALMVLRSVTGLSDYVVMLAYATSWLEAGKSVTGGVLSPVRYLLRSAYYSLAESMRDRGAFVDGNSMTLEDFIRAREPPAWSNVVFVWAVRPILGDLLLTFNIKWFNNLILEYMKVMRPLPVEFTKLKVDGAPTLKVGEPPQVSPEPAKPKKRRFSLFH